jgi:predicted RNA-binding Zn ribbon-like protein
MAHRFELVGGDVALDFLNTIHDWTVADPRDYLADVGAALRFGLASRALTPREARRLAAKPAASELRRLRELRARLERIFRAAIVRRAPLVGDLNALSKDAADAARAARLRRAKQQVVREVTLDAAGSATLRWRVVEAALALLTSERFRSVKTCPACGWFFLDTSKNKSRRWCSMTTCGSNAKARRYYWRHKSKASA